ncbi:MAG TPA: PQQ-binding-like beta-propeller repeat protein [Gemmatimonadales bacterium]|nr:PQQ-binding-like beta-propeller repeat protein [Gemmatimonadales bacterium]
MATPAHTVMLLAVTIGAASLAEAQTVAPATSRASSAPASGRAAVAWTLKTRQDIRWQQVTPAGTLLISTDGALMGVDIDRGQPVWEKPELAGVPADSVRAVEGSILMEAARPGLLLIFDPVTGTAIFDSRQLNLAEIVTRRVLPQSGTILIHGRRASGPSVIALYDLVTGNQRWVSEKLFEQTEAKKKGLGGLVQGLVRSVSERTELEVLQAGPEMIVVHTLMGLRALDARTGEVRWTASLAMARSGAVPHYVRLYPSLENNDRIYVSYDERLMPYRLADGQALWTKPATVNGRIRDIVQHPAGIIMLPEGQPEGQGTGSRTVINGVVQTGLNIARYEDGSTIASKPLKMRGAVMEAMVAENAAVLAVDAESKTFVNVLDVAAGTVRLKKDVKIKGRLTYAELMPAGLLYVSRSDATAKGEVNIIDLDSGKPRFNDAIESKNLLHAFDGRTMYVFADHQLYAVDREDGSYKTVGGEIKMQGGEDPVAMEIRSEGIVLISSQNLAVIGRDGQIKQQVYHPAPQLGGLLRALHAVNAVRAGLRGAVASAYGDAFAQASRRASDPMAQKLTSELATAFTQGGAQLQGYSRQSASLATKRFKASLAVPGSVFMLTKAPEGKGNVLLQIDKDNAQPKARVDLGKEKEPVYAVDDIAGMLFLRSAPGTLTGYRL